MGCNPPRLLLEAVGGFVDPDAVTAGKAAGLCCSCAVNLPQPILASLRGRIRVETWLRTKSKSSLNGSGFGSILPLDVFWLHKLLARSSHAADMDDVTADNEQGSISSTSGRPELHATHLLWKPA